MRYTEEMKIEIKQIEPPSATELKEKISEAKKKAQEAKAAEIGNKLSEPEEQLEQDKGSADGRMKIQESLNKELLQLDELGEIEDPAEWGKAEREMRNVYSRLENLIEQIKANGLDENLNMAQVNAQLEDARQKMPQIGKEKNTKEAKKLTAEMQTLEVQLQNEVIGRMVHLMYFNDRFDSFEWKNRTRARQLIDRGMDLASQLSMGKIPNIKPILAELYELLLLEELNYASGCRLPP
jgi:molecular chaperone DnaK